MRNKRISLRTIGHGLNLLLVVLLAVLVGGCETFKDYSLTCKLYEKKSATGSIVESPNDKYIHSTLSRSTLTPFTVVVDATGTVVVIGVVAVAAGAIVCVYGLGDACKDGAKNGGRVQ